MESDDGEYEVLDSTLPGSHITTVNVSGGVGGAGGRGRQGGGAGGNGEGPRLCLSSKSTIVNVGAGQCGASYTLTIVTDMNLISEGLRVNDSSSCESLLDSSEPPAKLASSSNFAAHHCVELPLDEDGNLTKVSGAGPDGWGFPPQTPTAARGFPLVAEAHCVVPALAARPSRPFSDTGKTIHQRVGAWEPPGTGDSVTFVTKFPAREPIKPLFIGNDQAFELFVLPRSPAASTLWQSTKATTQKGQEWKEDVERYMDIRYLKPQFTARKHPSALRDCAVHKSLGRPFSRRRNSNLLQTHIHDFRVALKLPQSVYSYLRSNFGRETARCTLLINRSTGRLCIDLEGGDDSAIYCYTWIMRVPYWNLAEPLSPMEMASPTNLSYIAETLTLNQYHEITCAWFHSTSVYRLNSFTGTLHLGGLYYTTDDSSLQLVALRQLQSDDEMFSRLYSLSCEPYLGCDYGTCGWRRISYSEVTQGDGFCFRYSFSNSRNPSNSTSMAWMRQANHIFHRLDVLPSDGDRYFVVEHFHVTTKLRWRRKRCNIPPEGYLFMCPPQYFLAGPATVKIPERPWYWSLDPNGAEKLNEEKATELGFPIIQPDITIRVKRWREFAYNGLSQFHEAKGFDPYSQEVAVKLNEPLFELFSDEEPLIVKDVSGKFTDLTSVLTILSLNEAADSPYLYTKSDSGSESDGSEESDYDSGSESDWADTTTGEDGHDRSVVLDSNKCEEIDTDIAPNTESTSLNETSEFTVQASTSASFNSLVNESSSIWAAPYQFVDPWAEGFGMISPSQSVSAWDRPPTTTWDDQIWSSSSLNAPISQVPTWDSDAPFPTPFHVIGDPETEGPPDSRMQRAEADDSGSG
ncbi:hypothetical protein R3P38DRAFT_3420761 [Favolaschia claudopus]|uniref:Uncharacterized protein n=1 Tax=Favolaschia claudopus TaxID=2862362 RepID=A0AAW0D311_9AGAR